MTASRDLKIRWFDDTDVASAFARSQFFRVKRTGHVRFLNLLVVLMALPFHVVSAAVSLVVLVAVAAVWMVSRLLGRSNQTVFDWATRHATRTARWLSRSPSHLAITAIKDWRADPRRRRFFDNKPPILYLRPFRMDNRAAVAPNDLPLTLEGLIRNMTSSIGPLIALGPEDDAHTASRAERIQVSDAVWKQEIMELMHACNHIVLVPEDTEGTKWELSQILCDPNLLEKTIFLNIAAAGRDHPYWARERTVYSDDDGKVFRDTLSMTASSDAVTAIPLPQIAGAAIIKGELQVFCAKQLFDPGLWSALPRIVIFLRSQSGAATDRPSRESRPAHAPA